MEAEPESELVRATLEKPAVHTRWISDYYTEDSRAFYDAAFDRIAGRYFGADRRVVLDAGCGDGSHSVRLAARGYPVVAIDFSEHVLDRARANAARHTVQHLVRFDRASLTDLPIANEAYEHVLCWGVLMHIPDVAKAISELARIIRSQGVLVVSENNMWSFDSVLQRIARRILGRRVLRRLLGKEPATLHITAAGAEYWRQTDAGPLICREARVSWLVAEFARHGLVLVERIAGEFTELRTSVPLRAVQRGLCRFNLMWFRHVRWPQPAMDNILVFRKVAH
jgi:2-polyprenyl-3-methyl-5-hydroxy-6-metoxy-1,4-benzoquinol methylase